MAGKGGKQTLAGGSGLARNCHYDRAQSKPYESVWQSASGATNPLFSIAILAVDAHVIATHVVLLETQRARMKAAVFDDLLKQGRLPFCRGLFNAGELRVVRAAASYARAQQQDRYPGPHQSTMMRSANVRNGSKAANTLMAGMGGKRTQSYFDATSDLSFAI